MHCSNYFVQPMCIYIYYRRVRSRQYPARIGITGQLAVAASFNSRIYLDKPTVIRMRCVIHVPHEKKSFLFFCEIKTVREKRIEIFVE